MCDSWLKNLVAGIRYGEVRALQTFADHFGRCFLGKLLNTKHVLAPFAEELAASCVHNAIQQLIFHEGDPELIVNQAFEATFAEWVLKLQYDVHEAGLLQRNLFPMPTPTLRGIEIATRSRPSRHVSGDLHDFISRSADTVIALVDAKGKGTAAGLYAAIAGGFLRGFASGAESPSEMLTRLNSAVVGVSAGSMYLTATILSWYPHPGEMCIASAGFPAPLISQGDVRLNLRLEGLPIGLLLPQGSGPSQYPEFRLRLKPGDWVAVFSDGVIEQPDSTGEEYGVDRLWEIIQANTKESPEVIVDRVFSDLNHHAGSKPLQDDQTFVFVRAVSPTRD